MREFAKEGTELSYSPDLRIIPVHLGIYLSFEHSKKKIDVKVVTQVRCQHKGATSIELNGISFHDLIVDGNGLKVDWRYDGKLITIVWEKPFDLGEERTVTTKYIVENPIAGMNFSVPDDYYPERIVYSITDHETERARYWLSCVDFPCVRTPLDFYITADSQYTILANGLLQSEKEDSDSKKHTAHWKLEQPCPSYLICVAVGDFVSYEEPEQVGKVKHAYYGIKGTPIENLRRSFGLAPSIMKWMENLLGTPFPFPKYYQIATPRGGSAMENISLTTWEQSFVLDEKSSLDKQDYIDMINCHEMAHSYFGDALVIRHYDQAWLKESWASYMQYNWIRYSKGEEDFQFQLLRYGRRYLKECGEYQRPIATRLYETSWEMYDNHLYPGGAWRIHMLKNIMGVDAFWTAVKDYIKTNLYSIVETDDFRKILEKHCGINLIKFFDQWFYGIGYPILNGTFSYNPELKQATLSFNQVQSKKFPKMNSKFDFLLEVELIDSSKNLHSVVMEFKDGRAAAVFHCGVPIELRIDPEMKVLFVLDNFNPGEDILRTSLEKGPNPSIRVWAAEQLAKIGSSTSISILKNGLAKEKHWGVRGFAAKALAENESQSAIDVLIELLNNEPLGPGQSRIAKACSKVKNPKLRTAVLKFIERELPHKALSNALQALGEYRNPDDYEILTNYADDIGYQGIVRSGALLAIGKYRTQEAYDFLKARVPYGEEIEYSRPAAVRAFAEVASWLWDTNRREGEEMLIDVLKDNDWGSFFPPAKSSAMTGKENRLQYLIFEGLSILRGPKTIPALEKLKTVIAEQMHPRIDRLIGSLGATSSISKTTNATNSSSAPVITVTASAKYQDNELRYYKAVSVVLTIICIVGLMSTRK